MATATGAINLSQGFPDFAPDAALLQAVEEAMAAGLNQYAPMPGLPALREQIALQIEKREGYRPAADEEVTVTSGATEALFAAITALVQPGDEVILLEPAYDSYLPAVTLAGGKPVFLSLTAPDFRPDWNRVAAALTPKTRLLILNNPHNPSGKTLKAEDLSALEQILEQQEFYVLGDEVYEHMVYDGKDHLSLLSRPNLRQRSIVTGSFGKSLHVTGWKTGYAIAPASLTRELRKVHQYVVFCPPHPLQAGIAAYMTRKPDFGEALASFYQRKRDLFANAMKESKFRPLPSEGSYYQLYNFDELAPQMGELAFAEWLTKTHGVATIPLEPFYHSGLRQGLVRFCFAKKDETLLKAAEILCKI